jgi:predicted PurR-regulated permease PerM
MIAGTDIRPGPVRRPGASRAGRVPFMEMDATDPQRLDAGADLHGASVVAQALSRWLRLLLGLLVLVLVLWFLGQVVLLIFASGLVAVLLAVPAGWLEERTGLAYGLCLGIVLAVFAAAVAGTCYGLVPRVATQVQQLETALPQDFHHLMQDVRSSPIGHLVAGDLNTAGKLGPAIAGPVLQSLSSVADAVGSIVFVLFLGVYLAAAPGLYEDGVLRLVPAARTARAREIVAAMISTLKYFLAGRLLSMTVIASCSALGLWAIGVPAPVALALLAGVMSFVPYVGAILSGVPPFLLAYTASPMMGLYVVVLYVAIHLIDGYLLVPLMQRRMVHLAPAVTLTAQLIFAILWGILGVAVATPLAAVLMTLIRMAYVEDVLGKR